MNGLADSPEDALRIKPVRRAAYVKIIRQIKADERAAMLNAIMEGMGG